MRKLKFEKTKYGKELLIDTADMSDFDRDIDAAITNFYIIASIREGSGYVQIGPDRIDLTNHSFLFVAPGVFSEISTANFQQATWVFFEGEFLDVFFNEKFFTYKFDFFHGIGRPSALSTKANEFDDLDRFIQEIHMEIRQIQFDSEHILRSSLYLLLIKLNRLYGGTFKTNGIAIQDKRVLRLKYLLENHIQDYQTVEEYAAQLQISRTHLNTLTRRHFSRSAKDLIHDRLLIESKKELLFSEKGIAEIAYDLNFSDQSNFNRFFKKKSGMTPSQFRKEFSK
ncbi:MAG: helix-turn-helix transcriptional regulator [Cyanothece sp. SIO1E1]|nr:helix-turn-helix transcriptional regulator [Cyanothece sp. SIO1E1]